VQGELYLQSKTWAPRNDELERRRKRGRRRRRKRRWKRRRRALFAIKTAQGECKQ
jgi:hypothetical protein